MNRLLCWSITAPFNHTDVKATKWSNTPRHFLFSSYKRLVILSKYWIYDHFLMSALFEKDSERKSPHYTTSSSKYTWWLVTQNINHFSKQDLDIQTFLHLDIFKIISEKGCWQFLFLYAHFVGFLLFISNHPRLVKILDKLVFKFTSLSKMRRFMWPKLNQLHQFWLYKF